MVGERPPLVMLLVFANSATARREWRTFRTAESVRGVEADVALFLREPSALERFEVLACFSRCVFGQKYVYDFWKMLELPQLPTSLST